MTVDPTLAASDEDEVNVHWTPQKILVGLFGELCLARRMPPNQDIELDCEGYVLEFSWRRAF